MSEFCPACEDYRATRTEQREETYQVRDSDVTVPVRISVCVQCGEEIGSDENDQKIIDAARAEYRRQNELLRPGRVKALRQRWNLSQKSFALLLGMSEATVNRYENGGLQDEAHDALMRACEAPSFVRERLEKRGHLLSDWQRERVEEALEGEERTRVAWIEPPGDLEGLYGTDRASDKTGFRPLEYRRFAAATVLFCEKLDEVSRTAINKLLFYADFLNFKTSTVSLTGSPYRRIRYGPAPADYGQMLDKMESDEVLECREVELGEGETGFYYSAGPQAEDAEQLFTSHELEVMDHVAGTLGRCTATELSDRSHEEPAWRETGEKELISYLKAETLSLDLPEEE